VRMRFCVAIRSCCGDSRSHDCLFGIPLLLPSGLWKAFRTDAGMDVCGIWRLSVLWAERNLKKEGSEQGEDGLKGGLHRRIRKKGNQELEKEGRQERDRRYYCRIYKNPRVDRLVRPKKRF
jgi:hypothetical protein